MKGKWAQGIQPRNFAWIIKDQLAVCERPGGYGANHRRVRRQEEIIWIREQGFTCVISLIPSPHNLHNYDELGVTVAPPALRRTTTRRGYLATLYPELKDAARRAAPRCSCTGRSSATASAAPMAGYLLWDGPHRHRPPGHLGGRADHRRQLGPLGRELVAVAAGSPSGR